MKYLKNIIDFVKLVNKLRNWESKYKPEEYDNIINEAFELIDGYDLKPGNLSPPFTLPNEQLEKEFIKKFFKAADDHGYQVISEPKTSTPYTKFNFKRK